MVRESREKQHENATLESRWGAPHRRELEFATRMACFCVSKRNQSLLYHPRGHTCARPAPRDVIGGSFLCLLLTSRRNPAPELASIGGSTENRHIMPSIFLTFRCRQCQQGRCVSAIWWDIRAINELKARDFSARCPDCGHQDIFFGIEAIEICHGELSAIERMELDEEELREFGLDKEGEREE